MKVEMKEVLPPKIVPIEQIAETLGLVAGLRAQKGTGGWRCSHCNAYQTAELSWTVWVPDSVNASDSAEAIADQCRRNAYNGCSSAWCLKCAKALGHPIHSVARALFGLFSRTIIPA